LPIVATVRLHSPASTRETQARDVPMRRASSAPLTPRGIHRGDGGVDELERREVAPVRRVLLPQRHVLMEGRCHHAPISITMSPPADAARYAVRNLCARRMIPLGSRESKCTLTHSPAAKLVCSSYSRLVGGSGQRHLITPEGSTLVEEGFA
jgi:hypothetical protein